MRMKYPVMVFFLSWLVIESVSSGEEHRIYEIRTLKSVPVLDGKVKDDPAWKTMPFAGDFFNLTQREAKVALTKPQRQTRFSMGATEEALYIGVICLEAEIDKITPSGGDNNPGICTGDGLEIFLWPDVAETYHHLMVSATGARWNGRKFYSETGKCKPTKGKIFTRWKLKYHLSFSVLSPAKETCGGEISAEILFWETAEEAPVGL